VGWALVDSDWGDWIEDRLHGWVGKRVLLVGGDLKLERGT